MSELTKSLRKKLKSLQEEVDYQRRLKESAIEEKKVAQARLEERQNIEQVDRDVDNVARKEKDSQNEWLRQLVEDLVIDPEVVYAKTRLMRVRAKEERKDRNAEFERQLRRDKVYQQAAAKNPGNPCHCSACEQARGIPTMPSRFDRPSKNLKDY